MTQVKLNEKIEEAKDIAAESGVTVLVVGHNDGESMQYWLDSSLIKAGDTRGAVVAAVDPDGTVHQTWQDAQ